MFLFIKVEKYNSCLILSSSYFSFVFYSYCLLGSLSCYFHFIWGDRHYRPYLRCIFNGILPILKAPVLPSFTHLLPDSNHSNLVVMTEKRAVPTSNCHILLSKIFCRSSFVFIYCIGLPQVFAASGKPSHVFTISFPIPANNSDSLFSKYETFLNNDNQSSSLDQLVPIDHVISGLSHPTI